MGNTAFDPHYVLVGSNNMGGSNSVSDGRLSLSSNTPVMLSSVFSATTIYYTPYKGNKISLYNGSTWEIFTFIEPSLSLVGLTADTLYDAFAYDNVGTVTLEALAWANSDAGVSTRTTALAYQDGILVKSDDATRKYLGTFRTTIEGETEFSFGGRSENGTEAKLYVWNYYNRINFSSYVASSSSSWSYASINPLTAPWRKAKDSPTFRTSFVCGVLEDSFNSRYACLANVGPNSYEITCGIGVGLNSETDFTDSNSNTNDTKPVVLSAEITTKATAGFNYVQALEVNFTSIPCSYYATSNSPEYEPYPGRDYKYGFGFDFLM